MSALALALFWWGASPPAQHETLVLAGEVRRLLEEQEFGAAIRALDAASEPSHPALRRLRAEAHVGLLDYPAAVEALEGAPRDAVTIALRIRLLAMLGRDDEARQGVDILLALAVPLPAGLRRELAAALRDSGLAPEARRVLGPPGPDESPALTLERGRLALAADDYEAALASLEAAASAPDPPEGAAYELGRCLALLGRREEAIPWLRRAMARSPDARFRLGQLLAQDPDPDRAAEGRLLLTGYEEHRLQSRRRALLLHQVQDHGVVAGSDLDGVPEIVSGQRRSRWVELLGLLLDRAERFPGARVEASRILAAASGRFPGDPAFQIGQGRLHLLHGDPAAAAEVLAPLVPGPEEPLTDASLSAARWLGDARLRGGDPVAAAALFDRVLAAAGDSVSPRIRAAAATAFAMSGDPERALILFDRVLEVTVGPARAGPLADGALVLEMLDRPAEAEFRYRASLEADPAHVPAALGLAELLLRGGQGEEAAAVLRRALEHAPESDALRDLLPRAGQDSGADRAAVIRPAISFQTSAPRRSARSSAARSASAPPAPDTAMRTDSGSPPPSSVTVMVQ